MNTYQYNGLTIQIFDDRFYTPGSADNVLVYDKVFIADNMGYHGSAHAVKIYKGEELVNSCIVLSDGGATGIYDNSTLLNSDKLLICCSKTVFCLTLPNLELAWQVQADMVTAFCIYQIEEDYLVQGELSISRINKEGHIVWQFSGADIFVSIDDDVPLTICDNYIAFHDFEGREYIIDYKGKLIA